MSEVQVQRDHPGPPQEQEQRERPALACGAFWAVTGYVAAPLRSMQCCTFTNADTDTSKTPFLELTLLFDIRY